MCMRCIYLNGHSYQTALLLSIFLGMFGIDRFYLGYPAIGLLKFCTLGFFFLFQLIDILLIASQVVGPSDGANYVIDYYGARLIKVSYNNDTYLKPQN
ncbi:TM2 domain-containing protein CG10795 [Exaiptasia diaphana]|nr:TM2 domain-containing protein CG10795 [Exaiptasia diaphana]